MHPRQLVRAAVVTALRGRTAAGTRVEPTRVDPHRRNDLPAIAVYTPTEQVDPASATTAPRELTRAVKVEIAGFVVATAGLRIDDAMDSLAEEIETAMDVDRYLEGAAYESILESTEMAVPDPPSDPLIGIVTLTYVVVYHTSPAVAPMDDFVTANAVTHMPGVDENNVHIDTFTVQDIP